MGPGTGEDFFDFERAFDFEAAFDFEKVLGFKERHAASFIALVFEVRGAGFITLETRPNHEKKKKLATSSCSHLTHPINRLRQGRHQCELKES